ncbi:21871_t:CDS:2, partial [Cetraspora pellucida]
LNLSLVKYIAFWEKSEKPSLKSFLDFRLQEGDLEREEMEYSQYRNELNTILNYHAEAPETREEMQQLLRNFQYLYSPTTLLVMCWQWKRLRACWLVYSVGGLPCGLRAHRGKDKKKSKEVNSFWNLQAKQQNIHMNLKLVEKRRKLLEKEQDELKDQICLEQNTSTYVCDDSSSCEIMPCPSPTCSVTNTLIRMPNKPIIMKATYNEYSSAHIICAFNSTIHLVKATIGEQMYEKVISMLQIGNKLVMNDSILKKINNIFNNIFQLNYSEIESKIISETKIDDKQQMRIVLDHDMLERSYIVEVLSPIFLTFRKAFPNVKYMWVEKDVRSIKEVNIMFTSNFGKQKTDLLILRLSDARELLNVEVSGPTYKSMKKHMVGDVKKLLMMAICSLCRLLGDRLMLFAVSKEIFGFLRNEFIEQERLQRKIRSFIPVDDCTENLREQLHLPDDDISLVTEEDMDEIFL